MQRTSLLIALSTIAFLAAVPADGFAAGGGGGGGGSGGGGSGGGGGGGSGGGGGGGGGGSGGGGSGGGSGGSSGRGAEVKACKKGFVYNKKAKRCEAQDTLLLPDSELIEQAWVLAKRGEFEAGRMLFELTANKSNPEVLNGLGYTNRKLGEFAKGIAFYKQALAIDPDYLEAREYLGEGYVTMGKLDLAKEQLTEIQKRCPSGCEPYEELAEAIETAEKAASAK
jgi:tetratricopeptide repeat protein